MTTLLDTTTGELRAVATDDDAHVTLALSGCADAAHRDALDAAVGAFRKHAAQAGQAEVTVDLRQLEFMNSSCIKVFVTWLADLSCTANPYRMRILSSSARGWQRRSLAALVAFATHIVVVEVHP